jgi:predicted signal transduction protein with EAL and GGDEF domain
MTSEQSLQPGAKSTNALRLTLAWLAVGVPLLWGVVETLRKAMALFA